MVTSVWTALKIEPSKSPEVSIFFRAKKDHLLVVNDAAERGVKLAYDFVDAAKSEGRYQNILQVVENSRAEKPDQRSKKTTAKRWFLKL